MPEAVRTGLLDIQQAVALLQCAGNKEASLNIASIKTYLVSLLTGVKLAPSRSCAPGGAVTSVDIILLVEDKFETELGKIILYLEKIKECVDKVPQSSAALLAGDATAVVRHSKAFAAIEYWKEQFTHAKSGECSVSVRWATRVVLTRLLLQRRSYSLRLRFSQVSSLLDSQVCSRLVPLSYRPSVFQKLSRIWAMSASKRSWRACSPGG